jgi:hypothetical protein
MPKRNLEKRELGFFDMVSGEMVVSDPCYSLGTWCMGVLDRVHNGRWRAFMMMSDEKEWGVRVAELHARATDVYPYYFNSTDGWEFKPLKGWTPSGFEVGVDSGQAGLFDQKYFKDDGVVGDRICEFDRDWYGMCCHLTLSDKQGGIIPYGAVSSSGYGDGGYRCSYIRRKGVIVAVKIRFI